MRMFVITYVIYTAHNSIANGVNFDRIKVVVVGRKRSDN